MGTTCSSIYPVKKQTLQSQQDKYIRENNSVPVNQQQLLQRIRELASENQDLKQRIADEMSSYRMRLRTLEKENNELLLRLSSIAGARLTDGNPNVVDLSNENRPTKLAEQFSELYDNEWTDAFDVLAASGSRTTKEVCYMLLKIVCVATMLCKEKSERDLTQMKHTIFTLCGAENVELSRRLKEERKQTYRTQLKPLRKELTRRLKPVLPKEDRQSGPVKLYVRKSLTISWLMAIQDPPVHMETTLDAFGHAFDVKLYRSFTKSGKFIDYIVWPVVRLVEKGALLSKGIAQGSNSCIQLSQTPNADAVKLNISKVVPSESDTYDVEDTMEDNYKAVENERNNASERRHHSSSISNYEGSIMDSSTNGINLD